MKRTDIHFHILPGIDDGPASDDEAIELAACAASEGTGTLLATPHVRADYVTDVFGLVERLHALCERLRAADLEIDVRLGAELAHTMVGRLRQAELETIAHGPPGSRWVLVESPFGGFDGGFVAAAEELRERGFALVLAHPERVGGDTQRRDAAIERELAHGSVLQLNAWSLAGRYGAEAEAVARRLLAKRAPAVLASDAHGGWRMPALELAVEHAREAVGHRDAERLVSLAPRRLLEKGLAPAVPAHA